MTEGPAGPSDERVLGGPGAWRDVVGIDDVRRAAKRLAPVGVCTPLTHSARLSERHDAQIYLKREDLQAVRSYKIRGAYNFIAGLPPDVLAAGVVCASAGNHGQGVAWSCRHRRVRGVVFVPLRTPRQKVARIRALAGDLVELRIGGDTYDEANTFALAYAAETGAVVVPTFDHPMTIAGQGTLALELDAQLEAPPDYLIVPVGGGGLVSGVAVAADGMGWRSTILGVQPAGAPSMLRSLEAGHPKNVAITDDFVDGAVVRTPGKLTFSIVRDLIEEVLLVEEGRICTELLDLYQDDGIVAEPAGALALAALDQLSGRIAGRRVVCILSGGNNDVARYAEIIERSLVHQGLKHYFVVAFPQRPGALRAFLDDCLGPRDDIVLFEYIKKNDRELGPALVGVELAEREDLQPLLDRITESGLDVQRLAPDSPVFHLLV